MAILLTTPDDELIYLARKLKFVREAAGNHGQRVNGIQTWGGGKDGDSWCAFLVTMLLDVVYEGKAPIPRTGSCDEILKLARANGWLTDTPGRGDLYLLLNSPTDAHHVGIVEDKVTAGHFPEISGNSSEGGSDNGTGVFERTRSVAPGKVVFVKYPRS